MKPVGLIIPTRWEAGEALKRFHFKREQHHRYRARIGGRDVLLILSGVGAEPARQAAYDLCAAGVGELVSAGFCGALVPNLDMGSLVTHRLTTVPHPVKTAAERQALAEKTSAVAVDMETQAIVEAGTRRGLPVRILRVVSDRREDDLTPLFGSDGEFSAWRIALRLLNPAVWPLAARLRRQSRLAALRLADAVEALLKSTS